MKNAVIVKSFRNGLTLYLDSDLDLMPLWRFLLRAGSCPLRKRTA